MPLRAGEKPPEAEVPELLDFDRRATENYRFKISPYFGDYVGDKLNHTYVTGLGFTVNLTPALGLATNFGYSRAAVDRTSLLGQSFTNKNVWLFDGAFVLTKAGAYQNKKKTVEVDLYSNIGGGILTVNGSNRGTGFIGGGMEIHGKRQWFSFRVEIRNYFLSINNPGGSDFESDFTVMAGPVFRLPPAL